VLAATGGCGGGGGRTGELQRVSGTGYSFSGPAEWEVERSGGTLSASAGNDLVSVTVFRLARPYRPDLWEQAVPELDRAARALATRLSGRLEKLRTLVIAGRRARGYEISYARAGDRFVERGAFLLAGRREYQLVCRIEAVEDGEHPACRTLFVTFRLA
jgi:hypothetical protein